MKKAPPYEKLYIENYEENNNGKNISSLFFKLSHKKLESMLEPNYFADKVLEVGSGIGTHFKFVNHKYNKYLMTDSNDDMLRIAKKYYKKNIDNRKLIIEKQNASNLDYEDKTFDRLIATHVLEHLVFPVKVLEEWSRVVKDGGLISIILPSDPGLLWRIGRNFGPRRNALKKGIEYDYCQSIEHVNSIYNLYTLIDYHFPNKSQIWHPFYINNPDLNLFYLCHLQKPKV
tara:strand:- start:3325 stop:4014 length:690 start_codon:yes stop_codon:yes gene_type:complete